MRNEAAPQTSVLKNGWWILSKLTLIRCKKLATNVSGQNNLTNQVKIGKHDCCKVTSSKERAFK